MIVYTFVVSPLLTNRYVASCEQTMVAIVIDPGLDVRLEAEEVFEVINQHALRIRFILNTHGHPDHTCRNGIMKKEFNVPILIHEHDKHMLGGSGETIAEFFGFRNSSPPGGQTIT